MLELCFPLGTLYLKRLHSNSILVLLFHNFNDFSHKLVSYVINVPATLRENGTRDLMVVPLKKRNLFQTLCIAFATWSSQALSTNTHTFEIANDKEHGISLTE